MDSIYLTSFFTCESRVLAMSEAGYCDKTYAEYVAKQNWHLARQARVAAERGW